MLEVQLLESPQLFRRNNVRQPYLVVSPAEQKTVLERLHRVHLEWGWRRIPPRADPLGSRFSEATIGLMLRPLFQLVDMRGEQVIQVDMEPAVIGAGTFEYSDAACRVELGDPVSFALELGEPGLNIIEAL